VRYGVEVAYFPFYLRVTHGVNYLQACIFSFLIYLLELASGCWAIHAIAYEERGGY
jgi:hypothetical protein